MKVFGKQHNTGESSHELTFALLKPRKMKPFTVTFPYPIMNDERGDHLIFSFEQRAGLQSIDFSGSLGFKKATREPRPCEFRKDRPKWSQTSLKPWDEKGGLNSPKFHLDIQFVSLRHQQSLALSPLDQVRRIVSFIFTNAGTFSTDHIVVINSHEPTTLIPSNLYPVWYLRVHPPILTSPTGIPMVILSAVDMYLCYNLTCKNQMNQLKKEETLNRLIFEKSGEHGENSIEIGTTFTREEMEMFRYVLRLNSTKIEPNNRQKNNLPLNEKNSVWLATFVSPLYLDSKTGNDVAHTPQNLSQKPYKKKDVGEKIKIDSSCAMYQKNTQNLKRCSRCGTIYYCSVNCQRADWAKHKTNCTKKWNCLCVNLFISFEYLFAFVVLFSGLWNCLSEIVNWINCWFRINQKFLDNLIVFHCEIWRDQDCRIPPFFGTVRTKSGVSFTIKISRTDTKSRLTPFFEARPTRPGKL